VCADHAAHAAVRAALPTLHGELASAGFTGIDVALSGGGTQPDPRPAQSHTGWAESAAPGDQGDGPERAAQVDVPRRRRPVPDAALDRWL
jgi:hypothetical protein